MPASVCVNAPRKASRCGQAAWVTTTRAAMQLNPALFTNMVATCSA
jgi:CO dehydrogenase/acetyl-CoA synthase beta subunit